MESFRWDSNFETGLGLVDVQHHGLLDLVNALGALLGRDEATRQAELGPLVDRLLDYAGRHILGIDQSMARQLRAIATGTPPAQAWAAERASHDAAVEPMLRALNRLFRAVADRNRALEEANRLLEARIDERTRHLAIANERLERMARTDALTGLANRRLALERLDECWAEGGELAVVLMDADGFKSVNDTFGHEAGDRVLVAVARALREAIRTDDLACRLGGDEFLVICPATALEGAARLAESLRLSLTGLAVETGAGAWYGSLSLGVAVRTEAMAGADDLLRQADERLYLAKRAGRNRVCARDGPAAVAA